jgi:hypothetical protein
MRRLRRLIPFLLILILISGLWIWWNQPKKVDMASYVPADALLYLEVNSLPQVANGLTRSDGWKALSEPAGIKSKFGNAGWLSRLANWTGIGSTDTIVFSRMQVAAVVMGVAAAGSGETLNVKPRVALIVETHAGENRTLVSIEKHVGNFARRAYTDPRIEKREINGAHWIVWSSTENDRRIFVAIVGSVAVIGNHESAVEACLATMRGQRPSLSGNSEMLEARRRMAHDDNLAFGYMSSEGATSLFEVAAALYLGQVSGNETAQGIAASILPQVAKKIIGNVSWNTRLVLGAVEDEYFISTTNDAGSRLRSALNLAPASPIPAAEFFPTDIYSITRYSTRDPLTAWRGLGLSVSSQLDPVLAVMVPPFLKATLTPYGIQDPDTFLKSIGPTVVTARLENEGENSILLVEVKDETALRDLVSKRLGTPTPHIENVGDAELLTSTEAEPGAASFVGGYLLMGPRETVRRCLDARRQKLTLFGSAPFQAALTTMTQDDPTHVMTFTRDSNAALRFILFLASQPATHDKLPNDLELESRAGQLPYSTSEMRFVEGGIKRRTKSSFGLLGVLAMQFATKK